MWECRGRIYRLVLREACVQVLRFIVKVCKAHVGVMMCLVKDENYCVGLVWWYGNAVFFGALL